MIHYTRDYLAGNGGGVYASRAYINAFAEISSHMTLVYPRKPNHEPQGLSDKISELYPIDFGISKWRKGLRMIFGKISPINNLPEIFYDSSKYDVVVFNNSCVSQGLISSFKKANIKVITIHHNFELEYLRDNLSFFPWFPNFIATYFVEKKAFRKSDLNLTLTIDDISLLKRYYGGDSSSEVIGVFEYNRENVKEYATEKHKTPTFIITGDLSMPQTYNSLSEWILLYYSSLVKIIPTAHLIIAGKQPSRELQKLCKDNNIELISSPEDMDSVLIRGDYYICPTSKGGGLKLRILDGLKFGMHVITHEVSARGYDSLLESGTVFKYSNIKEFEDALKKILTIQMTKNDIIDEYQNQFSFNSGVSKLKKILKNHNLI